MTEEPTDLDRALGAGPAAPSRPPSRDELVAFACGDLEETRAEAVREHLKTHPEAARLVLDIQRSLAGEVPAGEEALTGEEVEEQWQRFAEQAESPALEVSPVVPLHLLGQADGGSRLASPVVAWSVAGLAILMAGAAALWGWQSHGVQQRLARQLALATKFQVRPPRVFLTASHDRIRNLPIEGARKTLVVGLAPSILTLDLPTESGATRFEVDAFVHDREARHLAMTIPDVKEETGDIVMTVTQQDLAPGVYTFKLYAIESGGRRELADYELQVEAPREEP